MEDIFPICSPHPIWMPRYPKDMFHKAQKDFLGRRAVFIICL
jgi:hypothetical protein